MTADRELLERAAKAAGYDVTGNVYHPGKLFTRHRSAVGGWTEWTEWNPLTDDGDALRLAVKLRIVIQHAPRYVVAIFTDGQREIACHEDGGEPYAATRRAIVRTAAAMAPKTEPA